MSEVKQDTVTIDGKPYVINDLPVDVRNAIVARQEIQTSKVRHEVDNFALVSLEGFVRGKAGAPPHRLDALAFRFHGVIVVRKNEKEKLFERHAFIEVAIDFVIDEPPLLAGEIEIQLRHQKLKFLSVHMVRTV